MAGDSARRRHAIICGVLLLGLGIEALTLYPILVVFVFAAPLAMIGLMLCMSALVA